MLKPRFAALLLTGCGNTAPGFRPRPAACHGGRRPRQPRDQRPRLRPARRDVRRAAGAAGAVRAGPGGRRAAGLRRGRNRRPALLPPAHPAPGQQALQLGKVWQVAPVDKLSVAIAIVLSAVFLGEKLAWHTGLGAAMIIGGTPVLFFRTYAVETPLP